VELIFVLFLNVRRCRRRDGGFTYFSSTLDLPADWLPTYEWKRISTKDVVTGHEASYHNQLGHVQLPTCKGHASCGTESTLSKGRQRRDVGETWTRTEVAKRVLEFVDELYEVLVHDVHLSSLNDSGVMLGEMKEKSI
jgi:hypothetical protein